MSVSFSLEELYDAVVARFAAESTEAEQVFGWRKPQRHKRSARRLVWKPGDPSASAGELRPARNPGRNPRPLATLAERFTVYVTAVDAAAVEDERAQYVATRALFDAWYRAVHLAAHGTFRIRDVRWNETKNERRYGAELVCVCELEAAIVDAVQTTAPTDTTAAITDSLDDVDEVLPVP